MTKQIDELMRMIHAYKYNGETYTRVKAALEAASGQPPMCGTCNGAGEVETGIGMLMCDDCKGGGYTATPPSTPGAAY